MNKYNRQALKDLAHGIKFTNETVMVIAREALQEIEQLEARGSK